MKGLKFTLATILAIGLLAASAVGVAAQDEGAADPMALSSFYGSLVSQTDSGMVIEMTDPRASGELSWAETWTELPDEENLSTIVWAPVSARLVNENGSWSGTGANVGTAWGGTVFQWLLTGEGGYEGLTMMLGMDTYQGDDFWGAIVPTDAIPPYPELPAE